MRRIILVVVVVAIVALIPVSASAGPWTNFAFGGSSGSHRHSSRNNDHSRSYNKNHDRGHHRGYSGRGVAAIERTNNGGYLIAYNDGRVITICGDGNITENNYDQNFKAQLKKQGLSAATIALIIGLLVSVY